MFMEANRKYHLDLIEEVKNDMAEKREERIWSIADSIMSGIALVGGFYIGLVFLWYYLI